MTKNTTTIRGARGVRGTRGQRGFTLVEVLIVVIILGILAAIVVPQFSSASSDARKSNVQTQLQMLSQQIALYKLQHNDTAPDLVANGWNLLTQYTDSSGNTSSTADSTHTFGPYIQTAPVNPMVTSSLGSTVAADISTTCGWVYQMSSGKIAAATANTGETMDASGNTYTGNPTGW